MSMSRKLRRLGVGVAAAALLLAGGVGYAAVKDSGTVIKACAMKPNGQLRLNTGNGCLPTELALQWNQVGPQGPPGNTDSTVRHISNFMVDGSSVTTPVLSATGELGKLSLSCDHDATGGNGTIGFTETSDPTFRARVIFYSPEVAASPQLTLAPATFSWADTPGDNIMFEVMIEDEPGSTEVKPTVTDIHGFVQHFSSGGCAFYAHLDTSEINSGETFTP
jgi:hypothetical protein